MKVTSEKGVVFSLTDPKKSSPIAIVFLLLGLVLIFYIYKHDKSDGWAKITKSHVSVSTQWFQGGTLHGATIVQWKRASHQNKLATAGDWLAGTIWKGHLNSPDDFDKLRLMARILVSGIDIVIAEMQGAYADEDVALLAAIIITQSDDLGP